MARPKSHFVCLLVPLLAGTIPSLAWPAFNPVLVGPSASNPNGLHAKFASHGKLYFGTAVDPPVLNTQKTVDIALAEFGTVTPENSMKWDATEPLRNRFIFTQSDALVEGAVTNGKLVRGHTLVWHSQLPSWVTQITDKSIMVVLAEVIENHIAVVAGQYKSKVYWLMWDVCNEVLTESGALRNSVFLKVLGEDFIVVAFQAARKADPDAVLYINEYNIESDNPKLRGLVELATRINTAHPGTIDAIGFQSHLPAGGSSTLENALGIASAAPVKELAITEVDITNASAPDYVNVVKACLSEPKCVGVTAWGISDVGRAVLRLWDASYRLRPAYNAIIEYL